eukprot:scaffold13082_cov80-Isochrysis_galbana.AAC.1
MAPGGAPAAAMPRHPSSRAETQSPAPSRATPSLVCHRQEDPSRRPRWRTPQPHLPLVLSPLPAPPYFRVRNRSVHSPPPPVSPTLLFQARGSYVHGPHLNAVGERGGHVSRKRRCPRHLRQQRQDGDARVPADDWHVDVLWTLAELLGQEGVCAAHVQSGDAHDLVLVVDAGLLEHLGRDRHRRVDRVRDDRQHGVGAELGAALHQQVVARHAGLARDAGRDDYDRCARKRALQPRVVRRRPRAGRGEVAGDLGARRDVRQVGSHAGRADHVVASDLVDMVGELAQQRERLANAARRAQHRHLDRASGISRHAARARAAAWLARLRRGHMAEAGCQLSPLARPVHMYREHRRRGGSSSRLLIAWCEEPPDAAETLPPPFFLFEPGPWTFELPHRLPREKRAAAWWGCTEPLCMTLAALPRLEG